MELSLNPVLCTMQEPAGPAAGWSIRALVLDLMLLCGMEPTRNMDPTKATQLVVDDTDTDGKKMEAARSCASTIDPIIIVSDLIYHLLEPLSSSGFPNWSHANKVMQSIEGGV